MLKSVAKCGSFCYFSSHTRHHEIDKNTTTTVKRDVNELVGPRTMGHLIKKKYQVTGPYMRTKYIGYRKTPRLNCNNIFFGGGGGGGGGMGSHFGNNLVLCGGSIFFIDVPNELRLHWLSADNKYADLCGTL